MTGSFLLRQAISVSSTSTRPVKGPTEAMVAEKPEKKTPPAMPQGGDMDF